MTNLTQQGWRPTPDPTIYGTWMSADRNLVLNLIEERTLPGYFTPPMVGIYRTMIGSYGGTGLVTLVDLREPSQQPFLGILIEDASGNPMRIEVVELNTTPMRYPVRLSGSRARDFTWVDLAGVHYQPIQAMMRDGFNRLHRIGAPVQKGARR